MNKPNFSIDRYSQASLKTNGTAVTIFCSMFFLTNHRNFSFVRLCCSSLDTLSSSPWLDFNNFDVNIVYDFDFSLTCLFHQYELFPHPSILAKYSPSISMSSKDRGQSIYLSILLANFCGEFN